GDEVAGVPEAGAAVIERDPAGVGRAVVAPRPEARRERPGGPERAEGLDPGTDGARVDGAAAVRSGGEREEDIAGRVRDAVVARVTQLDPCRPHDVGAASLGLARFRPRPAPDVAGGEPTEPRRPVQLRDR